MSLTPTERATTSEDLHRHLQLARLSEDELSAWLGLSQDEISDILDMEADVDPVHVWLVRDALDQAVRDAGNNAAGWSKMTDAARVQAQQWFTLQDLPPRP